MVTKDKLLDYFVGFRQNDISYEYLDIDFDLLPFDFIEFAEKDLKEKTDKNLINALGNIKRAIECQIDILITFCGKYKQSSDEKWSFPKKIEYLENLGFVAPSILKKINTKRNKLEHYYRIPKKEDVQDAFDIALLFLKSTEKFQDNFIPYFNIVNNDEIIFVEYNCKKGEFVIRLGRSKEEPSWESDIYQTITIYSKDREFEKMMDFYVNIY
ncbi:MAG: hypothetical protein PHS47_04075 [Methanocellales archaeon]|nr:hypothetical protein [Methanocellales archaeon]MDD4898670.1 hypothetical protein [Methanocellales archaeon]